MFCCGRIWQEMGLSWPHGRSAEIVQKGGKWPEEHGFAGRKARPDSGFRLPGLGGSYGHVNECAAPTAGPSACGPAACVKAPEKAPQNARKTVPETRCKRARQGRHATVSRPDSPAIPAAQRPRGEGPTPLPSNSINPPAQISPQKLRPSSRSALFSIRLLERAFTDGL